MIRQKKALTGAAITAFAVGGVVGPAVIAPASAGTNGTSLRVAITKHGLYLNGPRTFPAGRVNLALDAAGGTRDLGVVRLHRGYTFHEFRADLATFGRDVFGPGGNKARGLRALNHAISHVTALGGLDVQDGQVRHGTLLFDRPSNRYVMFDDSGNLPRRPIHLTVTAPRGPQTLPKTAVTVTAQTNRRFASPSVLPARGTVTFVNKSTESPHMLILDRVKEGTTRKQVIESAQSQQGGPPSFFLGQEQGTDVLGHNQRMTLHLHLPRGEYAELCFFPDPKTGEPHIAMGMVHIVHLR
jgi:hypothetical protein